MTAARATTGGAVLCTIADANNLVTCADAIRAGHDTFRIAADGTYRHVATIKPTCPESN